MQDHQSKPPVVWALLCEQYNSASCFPSWSSHPARAPWVAACGSCVRDFANETSQSSVNAYCPSESFYCALLCTLSKGSQLLAVAVHACVEQCYIAVLEKVPSLRCHDLLSEDKMTASSDVSHAEIVWLTTVSMSLNRLLNDAFVGIFSLQWQQLIATRPLVTAPAWKDAAYTYL